MSVLGHRKHGTAGVGDRKFAACHKLMGATGDVPGIHISSTEGLQPTISALVNMLHRKCLDEVKSLFTDNALGILPGGIVSKAALLRTIPNLRGVGEGPMHLPFRCEYCTGGNRTSSAKEVMAINLKFTNALHSSRLMSRGCGSEGEDEARWGAAIPTIMRCIVPYGIEPNNPIQRIPKT